MFVWGRTGRAASLLLSRKLRLWGLRSTRCCRSQSAHRRALVAERVKAQARPAGGSEERELLQRAARRSPREGRPEMAAPAPRGRAGPGRAERKVGPGPRAEPSRAEPPFPGAGSRAGRGSRHKLAAAARAPLSGAAPRSCAAEQCVRTICPSAGRRRRGRSPPPRPAAQPAGGAGAAPRLASGCRGGPRRLSPCRGRAR